MANPSERTSLNNNRSSSTDHIDLSNNSTPRPSAVTHLDWQDSGLDASNNDNILAEIEQIHRFCENIESNLATFGLDLNSSSSSVPAASTPTNGRGNRPLIIEPVEIIDLSALDHRTPTAVIDLCTPNRPLPLPAFIDLEESYTAPPVRPGQRRNRQASGSLSPSGSINPSPPKRLRNEVNNSLEDSSYKCPVCLESAARRDPMSTKCGHVFCKICIETAIRTTHKCPLCNKKLTERQKFRIYL